MADIGLEGAVNLAAQARANGGKALSLCATEWHLAGDCEAARGAVVTGSNYRGTVTKFDGVDYPGGRGTRYTVRSGLIAVRPPPHTLHLQVRCRRCAACRRYRKRLWSGRARLEASMASRTWFATLTASPERHYSYWCRACRELRRNGVEPEALSLEEKFKERCKQMGQELTKFVKRVREETGAPLRFLWVYEAHKSGLPHVHGLIHECDVNRPVKWRTLDRQWRDGHSQYKLLTSAAESKYATKYLAKDALLRIRASRQYGQSVNKENGLTP